jgi:hypothetical protein
MASLTSLPHLQRPLREILVIRFRVGSPALKARVSLSQPRGPWHLRMTLPREVPGACPRRSRGAGRVVSVPLGLSPILHGIHQTLPCQGRYTRYNHPSSVLLQVIGFGCSLSCRNWFSPRSVSATSHPNGCPLYSTADDFDSRKPLRGHAWPAPPSLARSRAPAPVLKLVPLVIVDRNRM